MDFHIYTHTHRRMWLKRLMGLAHSANMIKMAIHNMNFKHASTMLRERKNEKAK